MICFFHYNIREDTLLGIGYVAVRRIPCSCSECLSNLASPWNRSQDKYNKDLYKFENLNCVYWTVLGSDNNWKAINCI